MDNTTAQNVDTLILDKKLQNYGKNHDFVAPKELTVTITLAEYRELVSSDSKSSADYEKLRNEKWALEAENKKLKDTIAALRSVCPMAPPKEPTDKEETNE